MSCRFVVFLLFLLTVQNINSTHARSVSSLSVLELPEVDGSAVDTCGFFFVPTPAPDTTTTIPTTTKATTPITRKAVATTKKPAVQSPRRKPETKNTGTPIRPKPAPARPITGSHSNPAASLLYHLLANNRGRLAGLNGLISQPMGGLPHRGYGMTSDSDESAATLLKRAGRMDNNRRIIGLFSSEDSSDES